MLVKKLKLSTFRNIPSAEVEADGPGVYVLVGQNGAGKTNLLEALSLLSPGQGLHRAKLSDMRQHKAPGWGLYAETSLGDEGHTVGMQFDGKTRIMRLNGEDLPGQAALAKLGSVVWFTPEMDRLFFTSPAGRRRFFDRLVFGLNPDHAANLSRYTKHIQNRARLIKDMADPDWVALEEHQAAHWGVLVAKERHKYLQTINAALDEVKLELTGVAEKLIEESETPEQAYMESFAANRERDERYGSTNFGPHRTDVRGTLKLDKGPKVKLEQASMGQHKRAILHILTAHAELLKKETGHPPCLLLDEVAAHLDNDVRAMLYERLLPLGGQLWLSGTSEEHFKEFDGAQVIRVEAGVFKS